MDYATASARREKVRKKLHPLYLTRYDSLCALLPWYWQPYSGSRAPEDQDRIYAIGRTTAEGARTRTNAQAFESPHNFGCASDWAVLDDRHYLSWPSLDDGIWREYEAACEKAGLRWGGAWGDGPHNELELDVRWSTLRRRIMRGELAQDDASIKAFLEAHVV